MKNNRIFLTTMAESIKYGIYIDVFYSIKTKDNGLVVDYWFANNQNKKRVIYDSMVINNMELGIITDEKLKDMLCSKYHNLNGKIKKNIL